MSGARILRWAAALALLAATTPRAAPAQVDTTVAAGPEFAAGPLREGLLGDDYRDLWVAPVRVEVLDLDRFAGGITPTEKGGGEQTISLRFVDRQGQEYAFRSVNKFPNLADEPALAGTIVARVVRDQVSSLHPAAALVAAPLLDAAGVLHVSPRLVVMPDDPRLGEFREEFAGMLGTLELRPNELEGGPTFGGFTRIIGTDRLLERIEESPDQRVDVRAYATARLMDLLLGDWDRHADQWRWGNAERDGVTWWLPIPRDRDYAFVDYDGLLPGLAGTFIPNAVSFGPRIKSVYGLTLNAQELDRRLLAELERPAWDSIAVFLQGRITDRVIEDAVSRMPPEYASRSAERLVRYLKSRREDLDDAARAFYRQLSTEVDVHATDEADLALVERVGEEEVEVRLFRRPDDGSSVPRGEPYFHRRFRGAETNEVRVYLHGGDDHGLVRGDVRRTLMVRLVGGGGDDLLVDSSVVRGEDDETALYDDRGDNRFVTSNETVVSREEYETPETTRTLGGETFRDWGTRRSLNFAVDYQNPDGLILGAGPVLTRHGFRKYPYSHQLRGRVLVAPETRNAAVELSGDFRRAGSPQGYSFLFSASQLEVLRFYGFGNQTEAREATSRYAIQQDQVVAHAAATFGLPLGASLSVGPVAKYSNPDLPDDHPVGVLPYGRGGFGQLGAMAEAALDRRDSAAFPRNGGIVRAGLSAYPGVWDADGAFGAAHADARAYFPLPAPTEATLAVRAGGQTSWGEFPVHEAAFLGGSRSLRGYPSQRFAGDAALFGGAELRARLFPLELVVNGELGALALADAGRVYHEGESPGAWHTAYGGGLWFRFDIRGNVTVLTLTYAQGEDKGRFYFDFGVPF